MVPEGSLPHSQVSATCPYPKPARYILPNSWRSIVILSSHLRLRLTSSLFPSGFPTKILYAFLLSPMRATCCAHLILHFIARTILGEQYRFFSSELYSFLHSPVASSLLGTNILLSNLFSDNLSVHSTLNMSDQISHPYKTTNDIIVLYFFIFKFLYSKLEDKIFFSEL